MNKNILLTSLAIAMLASQAKSQVTVWDDGDGDQIWSSVGNWDNGVPSASSNVQIGTQPTGDAIAIDTGSVTVASFQFNNTLTAITDITTLGGTDTLQVNGAITNNSGFTNSFSLTVSAGASAIWSGPLAFTNIVNIATNQITLTNAISFGGPNLNFDITNASTYGRFLGAGTATVTGATINIGGTYTGNLGDTFDLTSGNFSGATIGSLPTLGGSLTWDTSSFLTDGTLVVAIPEPSTWLLLAGGLTTVMVFRRRNRA